MRIRVKKKEGLNTNRIDSTSEIDEVDIREDILDIEHGKLLIYFRGDDSSGIVSLTIKEAKALSDSLKDLTGLVKGTKKFKG